jgi:hypothetical protein
MYYKVTLLSKGKRTEVVVEAANKREASIKVKKDNPIANVVGSKEVPAPANKAFEKFMKDLSKASKSKSSYSILMPPLLKPINTIPSTPIKEHPAICQW